MRRAPAPGGAASPSPQPVRDQFLTQRPSGNSQSYSPSQSRNPEAFPFAFLPTAPGPASAARALPTALLSTKLFQPDSFPAGSDRLLSQAQTHVSERGWLAGSIPITGQITLLYTHWSLAKLLVTSGGVTANSAVSGSWAYLQASQAWALQTQTNQHLASFTGLFQWWSLGFFCCTYITWTCLIKQVLLISLLVLGIGCGCPLNQLNLEFYGQRHRLDFLDFLPFRRFFVFSWGKQLVIVSRKQP